MHNVFLTSDLVHYALDLKSEKDPHGTLPEFKNFRFEALMTIMTRL